MSSCASAVFLPALLGVSPTAPVPVHPLALSGLAGIGFSALSLLPVGRMDGGRAMRAAFGDVTAPTAPLPPPAAAATATTTTAGSTSGGSGQSSKQPQWGPEVSPQWGGAKAAGWSRIFSYGAWLWLALSDSARPSKRYVGALRGEALRAS